MHLLHFRISHYNEKVRWALDFKGIPHVREGLVPGFHVPRVRRLTGQNQVPVLVIDGAPIVGSGRILEELERRAPEPALFPAGPADLARALAIQAHFDDVVAPDLRRLFWEAYLPDAQATTRMATDGAGSGARTAFRLGFPVLAPVFRMNMGVKGELLAGAHSRFVGHFDRLASEIGESGYLVGARFGLADLCAAAVMTAIVRPPEFPYPLPQPMPDALVALRDRVSGHAAFRWVLDVYRRHRGTSSETASTG